MRGPATEPLLGQLLRLITTFAIPRGHMPSLTDPSSLMGLMYGSVQFEVAQIVEWDQQHFVAQANSQFSIIFHDWSAHEVNWSHLALKLGRAMGRWQLLDGFQVGCYRPPTILASHAEELLESAIRPAEE